MTFSPRLDPLDRRVGVEDGSPTAAPGEALRPFTIRFAVLSAAGSNVARSSWSTWAGSIRPTASSGEITPSSTMSDGDPHGRRGGPLRVARLEHVQAAALDRELEVLDVAVVLLELPCRCG